MDIIRSSLLVALNDLIIACREAASRHRTAAEAVDNRDLEHELRRLADARTALADDLAEIVKKKGDIPNAPPDERELLETVAARVKAALGTDETARLLDGCQAKEDRVAEAAEAALGENLDAPLRRRLNALRDDAHSRIALLRRRHEGD